jgi:hypothetical protein
MSNDLLKDEEIEFIYDLFDDNTQENIKKNTKLDLSILDIKDLNNIETDDLNEEFNNIISKLPQEEIDKMNYLFTKIKKINKSN